MAIGYPSSHAGCACVDIDFALMGRKAVDFLAYEKGHRTVVFLRRTRSNPTHNARQLPKPLLPPRIAGKIRYETKDATED